MPIISNIKSSGFAPRLRLYSGDSVKLKANVSEYIQATLDIELYWYAEPTSFEIYDNGARITRTDGRKFFDDGFSVRPISVVESGKFFAQWTSSVVGNRGRVERFNYRVGVVSDGIQSWYEYFTYNERTSDFNLSTLQETREIQVQAVFSNGSVGPWVTAVPQL